MRPGSSPHATLCISLFIGNWDNTCRHVPLRCPCAVERIYKIQLVLLTHFHVLPFFFSLHIVAGSLICVLVHSLSPSLSSSHLAVVPLSSFVSSTPTRTSVFNPPALLSFLMLHFIPLLNICIHFPNRTRKTMTYSLGPQSDRYLYSPFITVPLFSISFCFLSSSRFLQVPGFVISAKEVMFFIAVCSQNYA